MVSKDLGLVKYIEAAPQNLKPRLPVFFGGVERAELASGMRLLLSHCVDRIIYILLLRMEFKLLPGGSSLIRSATNRNGAPIAVTAVNAFEIADCIIFSNAHGTALFERPSGTVMLKTTTNNYGTMLKDVASGTAAALEEHQVGPLLSKVE
ncbi:hypothetical protein Leryth_022840 [Lithospermum erythrorhizon]|nr:hypothetical protein Leryth_022840 [Lithospermum erythrorhizon]